MVDRGEFEAFASSLEASVTGAFGELTWNQAVQLTDKIFGLYMKAWRVERDKRATAKQDPDYDEVWENWGVGGEEDGGSEGGGSGGEKAGKEEAW